jgi:hypothetical protein
MNRANVSDFSPGGGMAAEVSDLERLDTLMRSVYGFALNEFMTKSYQAGYAQGTKNGKRLAKGKPEWPKSRGRPKFPNHEILVLQFKDFVDARMNEDGISLHAAVSKYLDMFRRAWRELTPPPSMIRLTEEQLVSLYKRATKLNAISDDWRQAYNLMQSGSLDSPST